MRWYSKHIVVFSAIAVALTVGFVALAFSIDHDDAVNIGIAYLVLIVTVNFLNDLAQKHAKKGPSARARS